ncbi:WbqC family protein [Planococcus versutus]|uniref:Glycine transferase n=1 Tax=Planococcus versutus TaxID=1302659 RepID=A0A1B1S4T0_9BACL|nr:WbqC family protein [Planococcus versutus]ANU28149.1 hypothetical protein I858_014245 [Planococcus versutus]
MKLGIMQPYFFPYIGYWQLIKAVDIYVVYDDVNYKKRSWINKNYILINDVAKPITLRTVKVSQNKLINEITLDSDIIHNEKLLKTIKEAYSKAPYFSEIFALTEKIINYKEINLANYLMNSIVEIARYLNIQTEIIKSSELKIREDLKGQERILEICKLLSADQYFNAVGGTSLYSFRDFQLQNIDLTFIKPADITYQQKNHENFVSNLSIIDVLMFNSKEKVNAMLDEFTVLEDFPALVFANHEVK